MRQVVAFSQFLSYLLKTLESLLIFIMIFIIVTIASNTKMALEVNKTLI